MAALAACLRLPPSSTCVRSSKCVLPHGAEHLLRLEPQHVYLGTAHTYIRRRRWSAAQMSKALTGLVLVGVEMPAWERVAALQFSTRLGEAPTHTLYAEVMGR